MSIRSARKSAYEVSTITLMPPPSLVKSRGNILLSGLKKLVSVVTSWIGTAVLIATLYSGWSLRRFDLLSAESGLGYALGIVGASLMLLLLVYPLRKRFLVLQRIGGVGAWFRLHMILGVLGPVFILFHSNFQTGSLNATVALYSMLLVATSGFAGRFIYTRIHLGLYGRRAQLADLVSELKDEQQVLQESLSGVPQIWDQLLAFAARGRISGEKSLQNSMRIFTHGLFWRKRWYSIRKELRYQCASGELGHSLDSYEKKLLEKKLLGQSKAFLKDAVAVSRFYFWERLFSLWHVAHIPLVLILWFSIAVHVYAVHRF